MLTFEVAFQEPQYVQDLPMVDAIRRRLDDYLNGLTPAIR